MTPKCCKPMMHHRLHHLVHPVIQGFAKSLLHILVHRLFDSQHGPLPLENESQGMRVSRAIWLLSVSANWEDC